MTYFQYLLTTDQMEMVCWLEHEHKLREGAVISLEEFPTIRWRVKAAYDTPMKHAPEKRWKVGGL